MKLLWTAIIVLFLMIISYSIINTLIVFKLQDQVIELQSYKDHFLHRLDKIEYWEVLPKRK